MTDQAYRTGRVTLVGAGPGSRELLTLGAVEALRGADVVLYDRLAPVEVLAEFCPGATLVDVGKRPGHHAVPQEDIERLLVEHALAGADVVRFKGGDPYVFGRGGEEVLACRRAGVPVEVIPGVTSSIAVPAAAGIPLTHRGIAHAFTVISGHAPLTAEEYTHLAGLGGTVVVLMGVSALPALAPGLVRAGLDPDTPAAVVERGHRSGQRTTVAPIAALPAAAALAGVRSPAVIVIGEVVRLASEGDAEADALLRRAGEAVAAP
ncbi:uroporphyrinogen-III C-methyltransferase [Protaetiibacter intestinalis]|uniref:uroporphyrinogen-III C-methyltransferase n=1 Tax=Protaetiibacter intestinalis TaxID=2419774 RepID=A0A387B4T3_9MICO|nr:uroporphyrinogen-III C-methyltransferase [Protaetiibacter intestinalis]AYF98592.1 uroporphyrinogen-III C-methyltransferase [Protaetiibacter intestinalis]